MSAKSSVNDAESNQGMKGWKGLHAGMIQCYRTAKRHAKWRWGRKKGARRARRRLEKDIIEKELTET